MSSRNHICQKSRSRSGRDGAGMINFTFFRGRIKGLMLAFLTKSGFIPPPVKPREEAPGERTYASVRGADERVREKAEFIGSRPTGREDYLIVNFETENISAP